MVNFTALKYDTTYEYPWWGYAIGIFLALISVLLTPLWLIYNMSVTPGTVRQVRVLKVSRSLQDFLPKVKPIKHCVMFYLNLCIFAAKAFFCLNILHLSFMSVIIDACSVGVL